MAVEFRLAIDLGTCHTVAVARRDRQSSRAVLLDGSPLLPSGVFAAHDGTLHTGRDATRLAMAEPARFEPHPKRRVDDGTILLGASELSTTALLAAVLRRVAHEAWQGGVDATDATVLTYPAGWGPQRRGVVEEAARLAGLGAVALVAEPVAAATYCVEALGGQVPQRRSLVVFDFGGGTLDLTVVRREADRLRVLATGGVPDLGGLDVDAALVTHLGPLVAARDPALWRRLSNPTDSADLRDRAAFWSEVRAAKEMLSRSASAPVLLPHGADALHLTRDELELVAGPLIDRAVDETGLLLRRCGLAARDLAGILLVGGSSRIPLVANRLHTRLGVAPTVPEQPELPVAYGALRAAGICGPPVMTEPADPARLAGPVGAANLTDPSWPAPLPVPSTAGPAAGGRRRRAPAVVLVAALVAALAGAAYWADRTDSTWWGRQQTPGALTAPDGDEVRTPDGFVRCEDQLCPATPLCWGGSVVIGGVASRLSPLDCAEPHHWETFVAGHLPADAVVLRQDELMGHAEIARVCSETVRADRSHDPSHTKTWRIDAWPVQVDGEEWIFHCLAGPPDGAAGSGFAS